MFCSRDVPPVWRPAGGPPIVSLFSDERRFNPPVGVGAGADNFVVRKGLPHGEIHQENIARVGGGLHRLNAGNLVVRIGIFGHKAELGRPVRLEQRQGCLLYTSAFLPRLCRV